MTVLGQIFTAMLAGLVYGLTHYIKKAQGGQKFDPWKLAATEVVGVIVAVSVVLSGVQLNQLTWSQQFVMYAGLIPVVENVLKTLIRAAVDRYQPKQPPKVATNAEKPGGS